MADSTPSPKPKAKRPQFGGHKAKRQRMQYVKPDQGLKTENGEPVEQIGSSGVYIPRKLTPYKAMTVEEIKSTRESRMAQLDAIGEETLLHMIREGKSQFQIGKELGMSHAFVSEWLSRNPESLARTQIARFVSAESWMDKGEQVLLDAPSDPVEITRARELATHYRKMAAIRNPMYSEKYSHEVIAKTGTSVQLATPDLKSLSADELEALTDILAKTTTPDPQQT